MKWRDQGIIPRQFFIWPTPELEPSLELRDLRETVKDLAKNHYIQKIRSPNSRAKRASLFHAFDPSFRQFPTERNALLSDVLQHYWDQTQNFTVFFIRK